MEGLKKKDCDFFNFLTNLDSDVLFLSETWCSLAELGTFLLQRLDKYELYGVDAVAAVGKGRKMGGLLL